MVSHSSIARRSCIYNSQVMWSELVVILILIIYPAVVAWRDSIAPPPAEKNKLWHRIGWGIRAVTGFLGLLHFHLEALPFITYLFQYGMYFWIVFDSSYALFARRHILATGTTALSDKMANKLPQFIAFKSFVITRQELFLLIKLVLLTSPALLQLL